MRYLDTPFHLVETHSNSAKNIAIHVATRNIQYLGESISESSVLLSPWGRVAFPSFCPPTRHGVQSGSKSSGGYCQGRGGFPELPQFVFALCNVCTTWEVLRGWWSALNGGCPEHWTTPPVLLRDIIWRRARFLPVLFPLWEHSTCNEQLMYSAQN